MALYNILYYICSNTLSVFIDHVCFADHEHVFLANTCKFCIFKLNNTMLHFFLHIMTLILFIVHGKMWLHLHAYSACLQYMEDTGRSKMRQSFCSFMMF